MRSSGRLDSRLGGGFFFHVTQLGPARFGYFATPHPAVVRSFRDAVKITTAADEILRAAALQHEANSRLRQHHEDTVRRGHVIVTTVDANTTLVRVATSDLELDLDKSSVTKKTLPKLLNRRLNTLLTPEQRSPGSVVIVSEADTNSVIAIWLPGSLHSHHHAARDLARIRHYVSGGWAKGCAAEPVASPERLAVLWNNMLRTRARTRADKENVNVTPAIDAALTPTEDTLLQAI